MTRLEELINKVSLHGYTGLTPAERDELTDLRANPGIEEEPELEVEEPEDERPE